MQTKTRNRTLTVVAVVAALAVGLGLGAVFFAKTTSTSEPSASSADVGNGTTSTTGSPGSTGSSVPGGAVSGPDGSGAPLGEPAEPAPGELVVVQPSNTPTYAYQEADRGRENTGTVPPPTMPVRVSMSSLNGVVDGQEVKIKVEAIDSQMYAFDVRICRADATFRGQYDFFPTVTGKCTPEPLSGGSDAFIRVQTDPPHQVGETTFRVGKGTKSFVNEANGQSESITCDNNNPCKLVLWIQVPYGFGFQEFPITYA